MNIAFDLDNTIDATPKQMQSLMSALMAAGHHIVVLTGTDDPVVDPIDWQAKADYLNSIGCGQCWNELVVQSHAEPLDGPTVKAQYCRQHDVDVLIDNSKDNARAATAAGVPLVLVPWASRS